MTNRKVFMVMMVKNEMRILPYMLDYYLTQDIDCIHIANNLSTDGTGEYLEEMSSKHDNIHLVQDNEPAYYQAQKMNKWIKDCYQMGADVIVPVDADEFWYPVDNNYTLGEFLRLKENFVYKTGLYHINPPLGYEGLGNPIKDYHNATPISWSAHSKVCFSKDPEAVLAMGNHNVFRHKAKVTLNQIVIRDYHLGTLEQYKGKVRTGKKALELTNLNPSLGEHWRKNGALSDEELKKHYDDTLERALSLSTLSPIQDLKLKNYP